MFQMYIHLDNLNCCMPDTYYHSYSNLHCIQKSYTSCSLYYYCCSKLLSPNLQNHLSHCNLYMHLTMSHRPNWSYLHHMLCNCWIPPYCMTQLHIASEWWHLPDCSTRRLYSYKLCLSYSQHPYNWHNYRYCSIGLLK